MSNPALLRLCPVGRMIAVKLCWSVIQTHLYASDDVGALSFQLGGVCLVSFLFALCCHVSSDRDTGLGFWNSSYVLEPVTFVILQQPVFPFD